MRLDAFWRPLTQRDVLVSDEIIHYKERQHWISLLSPAVTAFMLVSALVLITSWPEVRTQGETAFIGFTFIFAAWFLHDKVKDWPKPAFYVVGVFLFFSLPSMGIDGLAMLGIVFVLAKFGYESIARTFYRTIYLTNRRIVMAESPITRNISSVALGRITDISVIQTTLGGVFNYFHLKIETAGQDQALNEIKFIKYSDDFYQDLIELSTQEINIEREIQLPD